MRMLLTPGVKISRTRSNDPIGGKTRTAVSVATPHYGTPLANYFLTLQGQTLLLVLSALATSGQGRGTILAAAKAMALVARVDATGSAARKVRWIGWQWHCCGGSGSTVATRCGRTCAKSSATRAPCCS